MNKILETNFKVIKRQEDEDKGEYWLVIAATEDVAEAIKQELGDLIELDDDMVYFGHKPKDRYYIRLSELYDFDAVIAAMQEIADRLWKQEKEQS